jgi:hypothetical protein
MFLKYICFVIFHQLAIAHLVAIHKRQADTGDKYVDTAEVRLANLNTKINDTDIAFVCSARSKASINWINFLQQSVGQTVSGWNTMFAGNTGTHVKMNAVKCNSTDPFFCFDQVEIKFNAELTVKLIIERNELTDTYSLEIAEPIDWQSVSNATTDRSSLVAKNRNLAIISMADGTVLRASLSNKRFIDLTLGARKGSLGSGALCNPDTPIMPPPSSSNETASRVSLAPGVCYNSANQTIHGFVSVFQQNPKYSLLPHV